MNPTPKPYVISASNYFGFTGASVPENAEIEANCIMPIQENEAVTSIACSLLRKILYQKIRGRLGATYSPKVSSYRFMDHSSARVKLELDPSVVSEVLTITQQTISEISLKDPLHQKQFDDTKATYLQQKVFLDHSIEEMGGSAVHEICSTGDIKSLEEDYIEAEKVTYEEVARLFFQEFAPEKIFWKVVTP